MLSKFRESLGFSSVYMRLVPEGCCVWDRTLSFSVLITVVFLIRGGVKGAMMEASTRVMGMSAGKAACSIASLSMVSQKSSTCTSSEMGHSGQVNYRRHNTHHTLTKTKTVIVKQLELHWNQKCM